MSQETKALKRTILFIIIFILLFSILEMKARSMYRTRTDFFFQFQCFEKIKDKVKLLFLGTSQMADSINPKYICCKESFNLSFRAADLYYNYMKFKKYVNQTPLLKEVVIELPFFIFGYDQGKHSLMPYAKDYFWLMGILPKPVHYLYFLYQYNTFLLHHNTFWNDLLAGKKPVSFSATDLDHISESTMINNVLLENGFRQVTKSNIAEEESEREKQGKRAAMYHLTYFFDKSVVSENIDYLTRIMNIAKKKKIKTILLTLPSTSYYRKNFKKDFVDSFFSNVRSILDKYPEVTYYNFSTVEALNDDDFYDPSHLNYKGAKKFSMLLDSLLCERREVGAVSLQKINN